MLIRNLNCETKSSQQQAQYLKRCKENISRTAGAPHVYGWDKRSWKVELGSQQAKCRRSRRWKVQKWWTTQRLPFKVSSAHHTFMKTLLNLQGSTLGLCILLGSPQCVVIFLMVDLLLPQSALWPHLIHVVWQSTSLRESLSLSLGFSWWGILMRVTNVFSSANVFSTANVSSPWFSPMPSPHCT